MEKRAGFQGKGEFQVNLGGFSFLLIVFAFQSEFHNPVHDALWGAEKLDPDEKGHIADKKPFKVSILKVKCRV